MALLNTRVKLVVSFVVVALGAAVVGAFALSATGALTAASGRATQELLPSQRALLQLHDAYTAIQLHTARCLALASQGQSYGAERVWMDREEVRKRAEAAAAEYSAHRKSEQEAALWSKVQPAAQAFLEQNGKVFEFIRRVENGSAQTLQDEINEKARRALFVPLDELVALQGTYADSVQAETRGIARATRGRLITVVLITLAVAAALGVALALSITRPLGALVRETRRLHDAVAAGALSTRGDPRVVTAEFRPVITGVNEMMDAYAVPIRVTAACVDRIARGDLPPPIAEEFRGDFNLIKENLDRCVAAVRALVSDVLALSSSAVAGDLASRADSERHQGDFQAIVKGVNATLDALLGPVGEATVVLQALARRDLRARMQGTYRGGHAALADALNASAQALHEAMLQVSGVAGQVSAASGQIAALEPGGRVRRLRAGLRARGDLLQPGVDDGHHAAVGAAGGSGERARGGGQPRRLRGSRRGRRDDRRDVEDQGVRRGHLSDHQGHQRDRLPDQPAGAQRRGRGGARWGSGARLRGRRGGGPVARAPEQGGRQPDQGAHPRRRPAGGGGRADREARGRGARRHRRVGRQGQRHRDGAGHRLARAGDRD